MKHVFTEGQRVKLVTNRSGDYNYLNPINHGATVYRCERPWVWVRWDKPSRQPDGGYHVEAFEPEGGPVVTHSVRRARGVLY